ncbi:MAG: ABC transporter [Acidobacteriia bacterium]|nr:ABC transporter [Terriglobia bacterium]
MKYQVVLQWPALSMDDYDDMIAVEDLLIGNWTRRSKVDGHDFGASEANIFILTNDPRRAFEEMRGILSKHKIWAKARIAYRLIDAEKYYVLWPPGATTFDVA